VTEWIKVVGIKSDDLLCAKSINQLII